jgi:uncharacterized membrane protein YebE (DUF533 family)
MNINRLLEGFLGADASNSIGDTASQAGTAVKGALKNMPGGLAGGALAGGIMALILGTKKGRKYGGTVLKLGGMAALGGLAHKAYSDYKSKQTAPTSTSGEQDLITMSAPLPDAPSDNEFEPALMTDAQGRDMRLSLIQAMISAANADGHIDTTEYQAILKEIDQMGLGVAEKGFLFDHLRTPSDPIAIAHLASNVEQAAELYLASLIAIDIDTPEEQRYLDRLGDALMHCFLAVLLSPISVKTFMRCICLLDMSSWLVF